MNAQQVRKGKRLEFGWERLPAVDALHCVAHYSLRTINGEPFRGLGFVISEVHPFADGSRYLYRAANGANYWAKTFAAAEAGTRRTVRALMAREAQAAA